MSTTEHSLSPFLNPDTGQQPGEEVYKFAANEAVASREWHEDNERLLSELTVHIDNIRMPLITAALQNVLNGFEFYKPEQLANRTFSWLPDSSAETRQQAETQTMLRAVYGTGFILAQRGQEPKDTLNDHEALVLLLGLAVEQAGALTFQRLFIADDNAQRHSRLYESLTSNVWGRLESPREKQRAENTKVYKTIALEETRAAFKLPGATPEQLADWNGRRQQCAAYQAAAEFAYTHALAALGQNPLAVSDGNKGTKNVVDLFFDPPGAAQLPNYAALLQPLVDSNAALDTRLIAYELDSFLVTSKVIASLTKPGK